MRAFLFTFLSFFYLTFQANSQILLFNDSENLSDYMESIRFTENSSSIITPSEDSGRIVFFHSKVFKRNLPDGIYYFFDCMQKDSSKIKVDLEHNYLIKACYKDSARNGAYLEYFRMPTYSFFKKKKRRQLGAEINFKQGILDGRYQLFNGKGLLEEEGFFEKGLRHGFFIEYDFLGKLIKIRLYEKGILRFHSENGNPAIFSKCEDSIPIGIGPLYKNGSCK
jgi:hypothetical protein